VGVWSFDEGTGTRAADSSGNGNDATLGGGPAWTVGLVGGAAEFDGLTRDAMIPDSPSLSVTGTGLTLSTWIYPTQAKGGALIHKDFQYSLYRRANGALTYADSATWSYATIGDHGMTPLNAWSHVTVTFDGAQIKFYVNGTLVDTVSRSGTLTDTANPLYLGSYAGSSSPLSRFAGRMDEVQVYDRALSASEIRGSWVSRCHANGVVRCLELNSDAEITPIRTVPGFLDASTRIQYDPAMRAAKFTVPSYSPADTSGSLHIPFPSQMADVYVAFDVYYPADFLAAQFHGSEGWKMFILGQGNQGCSPYEVVGINSAFRGHPNFYYECGAFVSVAVRDPNGDNPFEYDYQPGGDTQCLRHGIPGLSGCARFVPDQWVTYQVHVNAATKWLEVWQTVNGKTLKIIDFPLNQLPDSGVSYEWIKLTPYQTRKDATYFQAEHHLWYRRVVVSDQRIPNPTANRQ